MSAMRKGPRRVPRYKPRAEWLVAFTVLCFALFLAWLSIQVVSLSADLRQSNAARDALARQVQSLGETPVAGPPGSRGEPGQSIVGPSGPPGADGATGPPGPSGSPGKTGATGKDGTNGTDGTNGASQTGAPGVQGPAGPQGPQGEPGPAGPSGEPGKDGTDGQTCPDGYSLQPPPDDPDALVCRRNGSSPSDDQTPSSRLLGLGIDPSRRKYA